LLAHIRLAIVSLILLGPAAALEPPGAAPPGQQLEFLYRVDGFGRNTRFREPVSAAVEDRRGLVYVSDAAEGRVYAFSREGAAKFEVGRGEFAKPWGLAVGRDGTVYVSDREKAEVKAFDGQGKLAATGALYETAQDASAAKKPVIGRICLDRSGNVFVIDETAQEVAVLDSNLKLRFRFGGFGDDRGRFKSIEDIATDRQGRIFTVDSVRGLLQVFDEKGRFLYDSDLRGGFGEESVRPYSVTVDRFDQLWIADKLQHRVRVFSRTGSLLRTFGDYGLAEGKLFLPVDVRVDGFNRVYVLEAGGRRLQVFQIPGSPRPFEGS